jgi:hypothetical protein
MEHVHPREQRAWQILIDARADPVEAVDVPIRFIVLRLGD